MLRVIICCGLFFFSQGSYADELKGEEISSSSLVGTSYFARIDSRSTSGRLPTNTKISSHSLRAETSFSPSFDFGIDFVTENQTQTANSNLPGFTTAASLKQKSNELNAFGRFKHSVFVFESHFRAGLDNYELTRPDQLTTLIARSQTDGYHLGGYFEASAVIPFNDYFFIRPVADFDYEYTAIESFTETGASVGNVSYDRIEDRRAIGQVGLAIGAVLPLAAHKTVTAFANAKYRRNFITNPVQTNAVQPAGLGKLGQQTIASGPEKSGFMFDLGAIISAKNNLEIWTVYRGQFYNNSTRHGFAAQIKVSF